MFSNVGESPNQPPELKEGEFPLKVAPLDIEHRNNLCKSLLKDSPNLQKIFTNLIPYIKIQIRVCNMFSCIPYIWDKETDRIGVTKSKWVLKFCKVQLIIHYSYTYAMLAYFFTPNSMSRNPLGNKLLGATFLSVLMTTMIMRKEFWIKQCEALTLWTSIMDFEDKYIDATAIKKPKRDKMSLLMMLLGICTSFGLPGFMCMMLLVDPCKPPFLGFILYKSSLTTCVTPPFPIRIALLLFDGWIWLTAISSVCFYVFHCMFLGLRCADLYLQLLTTGTKKPLQGVFKSQDEKDYFAFHLYRQLQILVRFYNKIFQEAFLPSLIADAIFVIIISMYACFRLHHVIPMPGILFFPLLSMDGFSVIFIANIAAMVYRQSKRFVKTVQKSNKYSRRTWFRKHAKSLDVMKIRFGSTNFIDEKTPLVFLSFSFAKTVKLMLVTSEAK